MNWVSLHAFHHADHDRLLLGAVDPLVAELHGAGLLARWFFLRYWDGGPHVRLRLLPAAGADPGLVRRIALERLWRHLAEYPAADTLSAAGYARFAPALAEREGLDSYLREPLPNNTVHEIAYRPETGRYGTGEALAAVERHFAESSRIALGLIAAGATRHHRHTAALGMVMLAWLATGHRPAPALPESGEPGSVDLDALRTLTVRVAAVADGTSTLPASGALTAWWRSIGAEPVRRVADLCAHLVCNRLGLTFTDERAVRRLAGRAVADHLVGAR